MIDFQLGKQVVIEITICLLNTISNCMKASELYNISQSAEVVHAGNHSTSEAEAEGLRQVQSQPGFA